MTTNKAYSIILKIYLIKTQSAILILYKFNQQMIMCKIKIRNKLTCA